MEKQMEKDTLRGKNRFETLMLQGYQEMADAKSLSVLRALLPPEHASSGGNLVRTY